MVQSLKFVVENWKFQSPAKAVTRAQITKKMAPELTVVDKPLFHDLASTVNAFRSLHPPRDEQAASPTNNEDHNNGNVVGAQDASC